MWLPIAYLFVPDAGAVCSWIEPMRRLASGWNELAPSARNVERVSGLEDARPLVASITVVSPAPLVPAPRARRLFGNVEGHCLGHRPALALMTLTEVVEP
jgi:hypothetical protein